MPTDPVQELLPPEADQAQVYGKLKEFADLLQEPVNYGTRVLTWCLNNAADGVDTAPPQLMFRRAVELLDALTTQIRGGAVAPAKLTLRALLECQLCGLYLVKRKKDRRKRAFAFLVDGIHRELDYIDKMDAKSNAGRALRRELRGDSLRKIWARSLTPGITAQRGQLQKLLTTRGYRKAELEYQRMKGSQGESSPVHLFQFQNRQ